MLKLEDLSAALPNGLRSYASNSLLDKVNNAANDPVVAEQIRENFVSYTSVMREGRHKMDDYLNAVTYVTYKLMGKKNEEAYRATFPARAARLDREGKQISPYVHAYSQNILVNRIMEQTLVPVWVLNRDIHQKAINKLASLMNTANSEKVQCDAANSLLTHLSKPKDNIGNQVNISVNEDSGINVLKATLLDLAETQRNLITSGVTAKFVAEQKLKVIEHDPAN